MQERNKQHFLSFAGAAGVRGERRGNRKTPQNVQEEKKRRTKKKGKGKRLNGTLFP